MIFIKKKIKLLIFFGIFIIISPIIVLYSRGDIIISGWNILKTGGIYIAGAPIGSEVFLNSKSEGITSFFVRDILVRNLRPGIYEVQIKKEAFNTWYKKIRVNDNLVSDADVFILPEKIEIREIPKDVLKDENSTSTKAVKIKNQEYIDILSLFTATTTISKTLSTSSVDFKSGLGIEKSPIMDSKLGLWKEKNRIFVQWFGKNEFAPKYLCNELSDCMKSRLVLEIAKEPTRINFLPRHDGVILVATENLVVAVQIEENPDKIPQIIYKGTKPDFRLDNGLLYVKDGTKISEIVL